MNVVCTGGGRFVEFQGTAESQPFDRTELDARLGQVPERGHLGVAVGTGKPGSSGRSSARSATHASPSAVVVSITPLTHALQEPTA
jgi:hypothetical protein